MTEPIQSLSDLDDDSPHFLINHVVAGLLHAQGASEDHATFREAMRKVGLVDELITAMTVAMVTAYHAPKIKQHGYLVEWPALTGGRSTLWSESDSAAKVIGCPHQPVYVKE